jgi:protoheme IX farnesyltransferase
MTADLATTLRDLVSVLKLRMGAAITLSALGGMAITPGPLPEAWRIAALAAAVLFASGSAGAFNQWAEQDLDGRMKRTADRPFVTGRFSGGRNWLVGILVLLAASVCLAANGWAAFHTFMGAFTYGVVYTVWLKRRSWTNIIVGGLAGSFAVLAGAAAVDPGLPPASLALALVLFLWTPPHFWSLAMAVRDDYAQAGVPMLPVVVGDATCAKVVLAHTAALSLVALVPLAFGMGWIYGLGAAAGGLAFTWTSVALVREPTRRRAIRNFLASLLQLVLLLAGAMLDRGLLGSLG